MRYILRIPGGPQKSEDALNFGKYIHRVYELGKDITDIKEARTLAEKVKESYKVPFHYRDKIEVCLQNLIKLNVKLSETLDVEAHYLIPLCEDIESEGVIDRICKGTKGGILVIDYKTTKREKTKRTLFFDEQLMGYAYYIHQKYKIPYNQIWCAHYYPLTGNLIDVQFPKSEIETWRKKRINEVWMIRKKKKDEFPPSRNNLCNYCQYVTMCSLHVDAKIAARRVDEQVEEKKKKKATDLSASG
jgi:CRISPR/Cas system-associated exonuclease Cas4 (RecB family)